MKENRPSTTAAGIALVRAIESAKPSGERLCYDPFARLFVGRAFWYFTKFFVDIGYAERRGPGVMDFIVARERYIDDYLQSCIDGGLEQLVILGAGYDSRAYRFAGLTHINVFEVDHPETQRVKRETLTKVLGKLPKNVVFVPIDFTKETLEKRLYACGYDNQLTTLFIWQGVTYYLTSDAIDNTLAFVANHSSNGSSIIFDYVYASLLRGNSTHGVVRSMRRYRRITGEAIVFGIEEGTIEAFLHQRGFCRVKNVTSEFLKTIYFTGMNRKRKIVSGYAIASAMVTSNKER